MLTGRAQQSCRLYCSGPLMRAGNGSSSQLNLLSIQREITEKSKINMPHPIFQHNTGLFVSEALVFHYAP